MRGMKIGDRVHLVFNIVRVIHYDPKCNALTLLNGSAKEQDSRFLFRIQIPAYALPFKILPEYNDDKTLSSSQMGDLWVGNYYKGTDISGIVSDIFVIEDEEITYFEEITSRPHMNTQVMFITDNHVPIVLNFIHLINLNS